MAIKRIMGKGYRKYRKCLRCNTPIEAALWDDMVYTCSKCGQQHYVDVYKKSIVLTVAERPDVRKRHKGTIIQVEPEQEAARHRLIRKVEGRNGK